MTRLYLITGFLGAGKTTFLHRFVELFPDKTMALIVNEFGKKGVDGALLQDLDIALTEINNGSIFCSCKIEQFEDAVRRILAERAPDLIFVEASGLADPVAVRQIFASGSFPGLEYAGAICLVDAVRFHKTYQTARVCKMQLAISDLVLINKTDLADREQIDAITAVAKAQRPERPVFETSYGIFRPEWLDAMLRQDAGEGEPVIRTRDVTLKKLNLLVHGFDRKGLEGFLRMIAEDCYRIKGFVNLSDGVWLVDCVGPLVQLSPYRGATAEPDNLTLLYGPGLHPKKSIREAEGWFPDAEVVLS